jgi:hypothetical protein
MWSKVAQRNLPHQFLFQWKQKNNWINLLHYRNGSDDLLYVKLTDKRLLKIDLANYAFVIKYLGQL